MNTTEFFTSLSSFMNIPLANCSFAYDDEKGETYILEINNALYLGEQMNRSLLCPNQCEDNGVRIDLRPKVYYKDSPTISTVNYYDAGLKIKVQHKGSLPYFNLRYPTSNKLLCCDLVQLTSTNEWDPYNIGYKFSPVVSQLNQESDFHNNNCSCGLSDELIYTSFYERLASQVIVNYDVNDTDNRAINSFGTRIKDVVTPEQLMKL